MVSDKAGGEAVKMGKGNCSTCKVHMYVFWGNKVPATKKAEMLFLLVNSILNSATDAFLRAVWGRTVDTGQGLLWQACTEGKAVSAKLFESLQCLLS